MQNGNGLMLIAFVYQNCTKRITSVQPPYNRRNQSFQPLVCFVDTWPVVHND